MNRMICSTGGLVVRANNRDYRQLKNILPAVHCDGVEFMMYSMWYDVIDEITAFLKDLPVTYPVLHTEKSIGEYLAREEFDEANRRFRVNCRLAKELGSSLMVLHLWNGIVSDSNMKANLKGCGDLLKIAADEGLALTVENVVCNCSDPMTHLWELLDMYPDIQFTFDTKMAQFHRQLEELYNEKNAEPKEPYQTLNLSTMVVRDFQNRLKQIGQTNCNKQEAAAKTVKQPENKPAPKMNGLKK